METGEVCHPCEFLQISQITVKIRGKCWEKTKNNSFFCSVQDWAKRCHKPAGKGRGHDAHQRVIVEKMDRQIHQCPRHVVVRSTRSSRLPKCTPRASGNSCPGQSLVVCVRYASCWRAWTCDNHQSRHVNENVMPNLKFLYAVIKAKSETVAGTCSMGW